MQRMCKVCGEWHNPENWPSECVIRRGNSSHHAPYVISDNIEPIKHHGTGRMISSKREFSKETRQAGMIELGNEPIRSRKPIRLDKGQRVESIKRAIYELRNK